MASFLGTASNYNDYLYTVEAFKKAISLLTPEGSLLILSGNKVQVLSTLYNIVGNSLRNNIVVLESDPLLNSIYWRSKSDGMPLLYKRTMFSKNELASIYHLAEYAGYKIIYSPGSDKKYRNTFYRLLESDNLNEKLKSLSLRFGDLEPIFDDSPFYFKVDGQTRITNADYWKEASEDFLSFNSTKIIKKGSIQILLLGLLPLSFLFYLLKNNQRKHLLKRSFSFYAICLFIGLGHTLLQTTITTNYRLFFGGTTLPLLLCSSYILLGLSIGAFLLDTMLKYFRTILISSVLFYLIIYLFQIYPDFFWNNYKLVAPFYILMIILFFSFVGTIFPYVFTRMKSENPRYSSFALVWDMLASLIVYCFYNDLLLVLGNKFLFITAMIFYCVALVLVYLTRLPDLITT